MAALELRSAPGVTKPPANTHCLQHAPPLVSGRVDWREYEEVALTKRALGANALGANTLASRAAVAAAGFAPSASGAATAAKAAASSLT